MYKSAKSSWNLFNILTFFKAESIFTLILQGISSLIFISGEHPQLVDVNSAVMKAPWSNKNIQIYETSHDSKPDHLQDMF